MTIKRYFDNFHPIFFIGLLLWYSFIFESFGESQAVYKNIWYVKSTLWKVICLLLGLFVIFAQAAPQKNILSAQYKQISKEQGVLFCQFWALVTQDIISHNSAIKRDDDKKNILTIFIQYFLSVWELKISIFGQFGHTGGPRYSRTFYLRIRLFTYEKWPKMTIMQSKMDFLSANSRFAVQNDGMYLPRITRETCTDVYLNPHFIIQLTI
jgi:hypothetical protein